MIGLNLISNFEFVSNFEFRTFDFSLTYSDRLESEINPLAIAKRVKPAYGMDIQFSHDAFPMSLDRANAHVQA